MCNHISQPQNTFVVRFWWEWADKNQTTSAANRMDESGRWRGRIEHVQSGERVAFQDTQQLLAFVRRFISSLELKTSSELSQVEGK